MFERCGLWLFQLACGQKKSSKPGITRKTKKKIVTLSCLCLFTLWPDGPLQNHTLLLFHCIKCFHHVDDCWEELNTLCILSPWVFDLCHCFLHDFNFWDPIGCLPLQEWGLSMWVLSKKWWKLRAGYPGSTSLLNLAKLKNKVHYKESSPAPGPAACPSP